MATANAINANSTGLQKYDGAGTWSGVTVTQFGTLVGGASNGITSIVQGAGQLLIGTTASNPTAATLTAGTGVSITSATGAITINAVGGGITWATVTVDATLAVNTGTVANKAGLLTMTLPATASLGDVIAITGINTALGWKIAQNANQQIFFGTSSTTVGITGSLASVNIRDTIHLVCVVAGASTVYNVESVIGNITVV